jgi:adenine-specific DNA-methyltransferase
MDSVSARLSDWPTAGQSWPGAAEAGPAGEIAARPAAAPDSTGTPGEARTPGRGAIPGGLATEPALVAACTRLGAASVAGWSDAERRLSVGLPAGLGRPSQVPDGQAGDGRARDGQAGDGRARDGRARDIQARDIQEQIRSGLDPLGDAFCALREPAQRRRLGQTFTPAPVIDSMISWVSARRCRPARVVDPGSGSARFLIAAGRRWPGAQLVGVEIDPLAALTGRASLAAAGLAGRATVLLGDYRQVRLPPTAGPTLFLGNPPYVRHHQIPGHGKDWLRRTAAELGLPASGLAGLHAHFFLATARHAVPGDFGVLITAAEWLDVNYGRLIRTLLLGPLGGRSIHLVEPTVPVFPDAIATSVISCFRPGPPPRVIRLRRVASPAELSPLAGGTVVPASVLRAAQRWGPLLPAAAPASPPPAGTSGRAERAGSAGSAGRAGVAGTSGRAERAGVAGPAGRARKAGRARSGRGPGGGPPGPAGRASGARSSGQPQPEGYVELGELCRVHRGQVTGGNAVWITAQPHSLIPARYQFPAVTRARELIAAGAVLSASARLRRVIDLPADLAELTPAERAAVDRFLRQAAAAGAADSYVARHRSPWWRVRLGAPPPILASYMGRRPPVFVRNLAGARYVNIAHGLYPREPLAAGLLDALAGFLGRSVRPTQGRVYAGGLIKFEPREMERLPVPGPALLARQASSAGQLGRPARQASSAGQLRSSRGTTCATATTCTG